MNTMSGAAVAILEPWSNTHEAKAKRTEELPAVDLLGSQTKTKPADSIRPNVMWGKKLLFLKLLGVFCYL